MKRFLSLFLGVAVLWIALRQLYCYFIYADHLYALAEPQSGITSKSQYLSTTSMNSGYNYQRTLHLIEQVRLLKKSFYDQFSGVHRKRKIINVPQTKGLLADLYRERVRLQHHCLDMKILYKDTVPVKKVRTLQYYQNVIETCISDVEAILRRA